MPGERRSFAPLVGPMSLIGVRGTPPHPHGNYFWLVDGPRVVNMWAENLKAAARRFNLVEVSGWWWGDPERDWARDSGWFLVDDPRIPDGWTQLKLCFTGGRRAPLDVATEMYGVLGDPHNELEEWTDPVGYWKKRGWIYQNGWLSQSATSSTRELETPLTYTEEIRRS